MAASYGFAEGCAPPFEMDAQVHAGQHACMDAIDAVLLVAVFLLAGGVKGVTGMGLPTVAVSLLGLWMPPVAAASLLVVPSLATNVAQCRGPHLRRLVGLLWPAWLGLILLTLVAPGFSGGAQALAGQRLLGAALVVYGAWGLWQPAVPDLSRRSAWLGVAAGAVTGWVSSQTAVFVMPLVPYLQGLKLDKGTMVQALGLSFTVATLALALRLRASGSLEIVSIPSLLALVGAFAGLGCGAALRRRLSGAAFQRALFAVFVGLGAANLLRAG
jgi:uncharacterized membrane protein YfcA